MQCLSYNVLPGKERVFQWLCRPPLNIHSFPTFCSSPLGLTLTYFFRG